MVYKDQHLCDSSRLSIYCRKVLYGLSSIISAQVYGVQGPAFMRQFEAVYTFILRPFRGLLRRFNTFPGQFTAEVEIAP
nr:MAG TPA: hypothetical protein [Bacteriophage sp.]